MNENKKALEVDFLKCQHELKNKTEQNAKLATEIKDLKRIIDLEGLLKDTVDDVNSEGSNKDDEFVEISKKKKSKTHEEQFNCNECSFQGTRSL